MHHQHSYTVPYAAVQVCTMPWEIKQFKNDVIEATEQIRGAVDF